MKINLKDIIRTSWMFLLFVVGAITLMVLSDNLNNKMLWILFCVIAGPTTYLFGEYLLFSIKKIELTSNNLIKVKLWNEVKTYTLDSLVSIEKHTSYPLSERRRQWLLSDNFYFYSLIFSDATEIVIPAFIGDYWLYKYSNLVIVKKHFIASIIFSSK